MLKLKISHFSTTKSFTYDSKTAKIIHTWESPVAYRLPHNFRGAKEEKDLEEQALMIWVPSRDLQGRIWLKIGFYHTHMVEG